MRSKFSAVFSGPASVPYMIVLRSLETDAIVKLFQNAITT